MSMESNAFLQGWKEHSKKTLQKNTAMHGKGLEQGGL